jgi:hypothetical protein
MEQAIEALTVIRFIGGKEAVDAADRCADVIVKLGDAISGGTATPDRVAELLQEMNKDAITLSTWPEPNSTLTLVPSDAGTAQTGSGHPLIGSPCWNDLRPAASRAA